MSDSDDGDSLMGDLHPYAKILPKHTELPAHGLTHEKILAELETMAQAEQKKWDTGQVSGTIYHGSLDHYAFLNRAFGLFSHASLLQRDLCPSGTKLEAEIIAMTARLLHGDVPATLKAGDRVCGSITSGGTESLLSAALVCREVGRKERGIAVPEIVAPQTIHPAFDKAAHYLGIKLVRVPVKGYLADVEAMEKHITPNTVALAASAGNYPWGLIDPLPEISQLAVKRGLMFHVDGCLGGFILPWVEKLGYRVPTFDFRLPGLTSMSCDTHKFGYGLKGTSVVLYRNPELRRHQYFSTAEWQGGVYASPTFQGSRSEGLSAAAWAAMVATGEDGYLEAARGIMTAATTMRKGIEALRELELIGDPTFLLAFTSSEIDVFHVNDFLASKGWRLNGCQSPPAVHFCVTRPQARPHVAERFVDDLKAAVAYAKEKQGEPAKSGALYGLAGTVDGQQMLEEGLKAWIDATYEP